MLLFFVCIFRSFGFPMGPFQMSDLSGLDVGYKIRKEKGLTSANKDDNGRSEEEEREEEVENKMNEIRNNKNNHTFDNNDQNYGKSNKKNKMKIDRYSNIGDLLFLSGRLGIKNLKGFYSYKIQKNMKPMPVADKIVEKIIETENLRKNLIFQNEMHKNIKNDVYYDKNNNGNNIIKIEKNLDKEILDEIIIQRLLYPLINEAFKLLGEGGVPSGRPGDIDIIFVKGRKSF